MSTKSVLVVDDDPGLRGLAVRWLQERGYVVCLATGADAALTELAAQPIAVAVCDINMPGRDGLWLAGEIRRLYPETAVIMVTGGREFSAAVTSLRHGVVDYLLKPIGRDQLCDAVARGLGWRADAVDSRLRRERLREELDARKRGLAEALAAMPPPSEDGLLAIMKLVSLHDPGGFAHAERVRHWSLLIAGALQLDAAAHAAIAQAALVHDIGEMVIPNAIMQKTSSLSDVEQEIVRQHPQLGCEILRAVPFLSRSADIVRATHERFDGSGYPGGLRGEEIPLASRIIAAADVFDAMIRPETYRGPLTTPEAVAGMIRVRGTLFDPHVVDAFVEALGVTPEPEPESDDAVTIGIEF